MGKKILLNEQQNRELLSDGETTISGVPYTMVGRHVKKSDAWTACGSRMELARGKSYWFVIERKRLDNVEFVTRFMQDGNGLCQGWVLQALYEFSKAIVSDEGAIRKEMAENGSEKFISPDAWIACARDFKEKYEKNYQQ